MGSLNEILSLMYKIDSGYKKAVQCNENSNSYSILVENREQDAHKRSRLEIRKVFLPKKLTDDDVEEKLVKFDNVFYHDPKMRSSAVMRLEPLFCRIAYENGFGKYTCNEKVLDRLQSILIFLFNKQTEINLAKAISTEFLFNGTFEQLEAQFGHLVDEEYEKRLKAKATNNVNADNNQNEYIIQGPLDFETANKIGALSCPNSILCYTRNESVWCSYTKNGYNTAYVALMKGWENIPAVHDQDFLSPYDPTHTPTNRSPYDTYGLSMIFVFVSPKGHLTTCNTRWNHEADYNGLVDHALKIEDLEKILGVDFAIAFKPNMVEDYASKINGELQQCRGFRQMYLVLNKYFIDYDYIDSECKKTMYVKGNLGCNVLNLRTKTLIYENWFDEIECEGDNCARVILNGYENVINANGMLVWDKPIDEWFENVWLGGAEQGVFEVMKRNKYNYITSKGELLWKKPWDEWFDMVCEFRNGCGVVVLNHKQNLINTKGKLIFKEWMDNIGDTSFYHYNDNNTELIYEKEGKHNVLTDDCKLLWKKPWDEWFDACDASHATKRCFYVCRDKKFNILTFNGELICEFWFDKLEKIDNSPNEVAKVYINGKCNFVKTDFTFVWQYPVQEWFNEMFADMSETQEGGVYMAVDKEKKHVYYVKNNQIIEQIA